MGYNIAVAGATGAVGQEMLRILAEREFPVDNIVALASSRSTGREVSFGEERLRCEDLATFDFGKTDIALFSPGAKVSALHAPKAADSGCIVIDNTSRFRYDDDVPLVVPEVNPHHLRHYGNRNIVANPNCSTIQMVVALKPLHDLVPIKRVVAATYQAVGGAGKKGMDELYEQTKKKYWNESHEPSVFQSEIAFNCIPHIDEFMDDGSTKEEWKMVVETRKILDSRIAVHATCVRVPVFVGHAEAVNVEFEDALPVEEAREQLMESDGVVVIDRQEPGGYATQKDSTLSDAVFVSRLRRDPTVDHGLSMWIVSNNLRKGAALNSVQIAETLHHDHLRK